MFAGLQIVLTMQGKTWHLRVKPQNGASITILVDCKEIALLSTLLPVEAHLQPNAKRDL
jgi:hypothetical protein